MPSRLKVSISGANPTSATGAAESCKCLETWASSPKGRHYIGVSAAGALGKSGTEDNHARVFLELREEFWDATICMLKSKNAAIAQLINSAFCAATTHCRFSCMNEGERWVIQAPEPRAHPIEADDLDSVGACTGGIFDVPHCQLCIDHAVIRQTEEMPSSVEAWLNEINASLHAFDRAFGLTLNTVRISGIVDHSFRKLLTSDFGGK